MNGIIFMVFTAAACPPCERMKQDFADDPRVRFIDIKANPEMAKDYDVNRTPTVVALRDGEEVARTVGYNGKAEMRRWMDRAAGGRVAGRGRRKGSGAAPDAARPPAAMLEPRPEIIDRLRSRSYESKAPDRLAEQAADEIERLWKIVTGQGCNAVICSNRWRGIKNFFKGA